MGSTQTKTHDVPVKAYQNLHTNRSECLGLRRQTVDAFTQHEKPSNLTIKQSHYLKNAKDQPNDIIVPTNNSHNLTKSTTNKIPVAKKIPDDSIIPISKQKLKPMLTPPMKLKPMLKPPMKLNDLNDFIENWNSWKEELKSFLTLTDERKLKYHQWGSILLHFMGPYGHEILNELFFNLEEDKKDYIILLNKYDLFYKFHTTYKSKDENTIIYIEKLKEMVAQNFKNVDITIKQKIAQEIENNCKDRFIALAKSKLPNFKFATKFKLLTLAEISFLWDICEEFDLRENSNSLCCGQLHRQEKCPASDNQCSKCKKKGHLAICCQTFKHVINNCNFCGGNHRKGHCLSYGETCSRCGHLNHFSWCCPRNTVKQHCRYCDQKHLKGKHYCPAKNNLCSTCGEIGHYTETCTKIKNIMNALEID